MGIGDLGAVDREPGVLMQPTCEACVRLSREVALAVQRTNVAREEYVETAVKKLGTDAARAGLARARIAECQAIKGLDANCGKHAC